MPYAINIRADNATAEPIRELWDRIEEHNGVSTMRDLNYPPHFTFAIYEKVDTDHLRLAAEQLFKERAAQRIRFNTIASFQTSPLVLWLKAEDESPLHEMHTIVHQFIPSKFCREHYKPEFWQPHCTLAMNISDELRERALNLASTPFEPFEVCFDTIDWVRFLPVEILGEFKLPASSCP